MAQHTTTYAVTGMTCENCVKHVTSELSEIDGVTGVSVELITGGASQVIVTSDQPIPADVAHAAIDEAGYVVEV